MSDEADVSMILGSRLDALQSAKLKRLESDIAALAFAAGRTVRICEYRSIEDRALLEFSGPQGLGLQLAAADFMRQSDAESLQEVRKQLAGVMPGGGT